MRSESPTGTRRPRARAGAKALPPVGRDAKQRDVARVVSRDVARVALAVALAAAACTGGFGPESEEPEVPAKSIPVAGEPPPLALHRLTGLQYTNTLRDLLGEPLKIETKLEPDTSLHGFTTVGASELTISPVEAEQFEAVAYEVTGQVFGDAKRRDAFVGCKPASGDDDCARSFIADFGLRAWRRPLVTDEVDALAALSAKIAKSFNAPFTGLRYAAAAILQSPYFLFRVEQGVPTTADRVALSGFEIASRLSYLLWNSTPDEGLLGAAERGDLDSPDGIRAEAERMLESDRTRDALTNFFSEYLALERLDHLTKDQDLFDVMSPTLGASMRGEIRRVFADIAFDKDGDFRDIMTTRETFVNDELAELYGLPSSATSGEADEEGFVRVTLPEDGERGGLLTSAALLALYAHNTVTSPTLRGKFIRVNLLCQDVPAPPPGAATALEDEGEGEGKGPKTMRQKLEKHRTNPTCAGCHIKMDPLGLGLEHFDAIGQYRETDQGLPIDATGDVDGIKFDGALELGQVLRDSPRVAACIARRFYRYALGHLEERDEEGSIELLAHRFEQGGYRFRELVLETVTSEAFRLARKP